MKRKTAACLLSIMIPVAVRAQNTAPSAAAVHAQPPRSAILQDDSFQSQSLGRSMPYRILVPGDYNPRGRRYPALYLLHGLTGAYSDWDGRTNLAHYAERYELIIVMPEGNDAWYMNSAGEAQGKYEDYIVKDLIPEIDRKYHTINARHARAIAGLSMGGYGALKFGLKFPQMFAFAGSFSGALNVARDAEFMTRPGKYRDGVMKIFGPAGSQARAENDIYALVKKAEPGLMPEIYLDCGTEDGLLQANRDFAALLQKQKIRYEYRELPGAHTWPYWDQQIQQMLMVLAAIMKIE